jgi:Glu-tRNA(Gln) amidotransferase subunit E-like FAD-binding protein
MMQKIVLAILMISLSISSLNAQQNKREKLKAYKTAFITQHLDLTPKEAEKFWPIYNIFEKEIFQLKVLNQRDGRQRIKEKGGLDSLKNEEAEKFLSELMQNEQDILEAKKELFHNLKNVIPAKKILKLNRVEYEFNRKLLNEFRNKKRPD